MTTDAGATWTDISAGGPHAGIHHMTVDHLPNGQHRVLVSTDGGLWRREVDGNWTNLNGNLAISLINGVSTNPTGITSIVAGSQANGTNVFSDSQTWERVDGYGGGQVAIDPNNVQTIYAVSHLTGTNAVLRKSTNGGQTWTTVLAIANPDAPLTVDAVNTARVLVGGHRIMESNNGGATWTNLLGADHRPGPRHRQRPGRLRPRPELPAGQRQGHQRLRRGHRLRHQRLLDLRHQEPRPDLDEPHLQPDRPGLDHRHRGRSAQPRHHLRRPPGLRRRPGLPLHGRRPHVDQYHERPAQRAGFEARHRPAQRLPLRRHRRGRVHLHQRRRRLEPLRRRLAQRAGQGPGTQPDHQHARGRHLRPKRLPALPRLAADTDDAGRCRGGRAVGLLHLDRPGDAGRRAGHQPRHGGGLRHAEPAEHDPRRVAQLRRADQRPDGRLQPDPRQGRPGRRRLLGVEHLRRRDLRRGRRLDRR